MSTPETGHPEPAEPLSPGRRGGGTAGRLVFLAISLACFAYLYYRLNGAAAREGRSLVDYMVGVFAGVRWVSWILLMVAYSGFYFAIDTLVATRALTWFVTPIRYRDILPIRASAYIISIFNEQIGKGAMAYYLNKRHAVPGWEVGSVMLFIMFCEVFYLLTWATIGFAFSGDSLPDAFGLIPYLAVGAVVVLVAWILYFKGVLLPGNRLREKRILHAFKAADLRHYALFLLLRSPALLAAVVVYTVALRLFGVDAAFLSLLGYLPVIFFAAAVPTPMRAASSSTTSSSCSTPCSAWRSGGARSASCSPDRSPDVLAHLLTGVRLVAVLPVAVAFARPDGLSAGLVALVGHRHRLPRRTGGAVARHRLPGRPALRPRHGLPVRHRRAHRRRAGRPDPGGAAGADRRGVHAVRVRFLLGAPAEAAADEPAGPVERRALLRAAGAAGRRTARRGAGVDAMAGPDGPRERVRTGGVDGPVDRRPRLGRGSVIASVLQTRRPGTTGRQTGCPVAVRRGVPPRGRSSRATRRGTTTSGRGVACPAAAPGWPVPRAS